MRSHSTHYEKNWDTKLIIPRRKRSHYVGVPQLCDLFADETTFKTHRNYASQALKQLMGTSFKAHKLKTEFNRNATNAVKAISPHITRGGFLMATISTK